MLHSTAADSSYRLIAAIVIAAHCLFLFWAGWVTDNGIKPKPRERLIVKTVTLDRKPPKFSKALVQDPPPRTAPLPVKEAVKEKPAPKETPKQTPPPPPTPPKKITQKKPVPTKKITQPAKPKEIPKKQPEKKPSTAQVQPVKSPPVNTKTKDLLAKAQEKIAKIHSTKDKISSNALSQSSKLQVPALSDIKWNKSDEELSDREMDYREELASRLKLLLRLPEYGDVKIKLTLKRAGSVSKVVIVSSESESNKKYVEKALLGLTFPPFGNNFPGIDDYTFSITLSNAL